MKTSTKNWVFKGVKFTKGGKVFEVVDVRGNDVTLRRQDGMLQQSFKGFLKKCSLYQEV